MQRTKMLLLVAAAVLTLIVSPGAAKEPQSRGSAGGEGARGLSQSASQKSGQGTGIPECDTYFAMVEACMPKMSQEDQRAAESNVDRLRTMLPIAASPQGRATLAQRCTASIEQEQQHDKYRCYEPEKAGGRGR